MAVAQAHPSALPETVRPAWRAHVAPRNEAHAVPASVLACDALLRQLTAIRDTLILPLARAATMLAAHDGWRSYGYVTRTDFARERLQRDGHWPADLLRLHETVDRLPAVGRALCGTDGTY